MSEYQYVEHEFAPVYNEESQVLVLGSLPSVKSREQGFYYGHPRNRFWKVVAAVLGVPEPLTIEEKKRMLLLRQRFPSMLINGPFSILVGFTGGMMALNDRLKLRSMVVAETADIAYVASEECAIRRIAPDVTNVWAPRGGQPVIFTTEGGRA